MPSPHTSFARLRFASASKPKVAAMQVIPPALDMPRAEALDLLDWLGLGRPDFGAVQARELAPRCRRRLWDVRRNANPALRARTSQLLAVAEAAGEGVVLFG